MNFQNSIYRGNLAGWIRSGGYLAGWNPVRATWLGGTQSGRPVWVEPSQGNLAGMEPGQAVSPAGTWGFCIKIWCKPELFAGCWQPGWVEPGQAVSPLPGWVEPSQDNRAGLEPGQAVSPAGT